METKCERVQLRFSTKDLNKIKMYAKMHSNGSVTTYLTTQALFAPVVQSEMEMAKKTPSKKKGQNIILETLCVKCLKEKRNGIRRRRLVRSRKDT